MSELGKHSTSRGEYFEERADARETVTFEVGDFLLRLDRQWKLYIPERKDGEPVPPALTGKWTSPQDFALKLDQFDQVRRKGDENAV